MSFYLFSQNFTNPENTFKKFSSFQFFYSERSEAEGRAERGIGLVKKKMNKKKRNHYDDDDYDDDQFCTRSNILPFFSKFSHLCSFFSLQKVFMVSTTYQLFAKDILTKSFVRKKFF